MPRSTDISGTIISFCALALAALLPAFFLPVSWITFAQAKALLIALVLLIALFAWSIGSYKSGNVLVPRGAIVWSALVLAIVYLTSAFFSVSRYASFAGGSGESNTFAMMCLFAGVLMLSALVFGQDEDRRAVFIRSLVVSGLVLFIVCAAQLLLPAFFTAFASAPPIGSIHDMAIFLGLFPALLLFTFNSEQFEGAWRFLLFGLAALATAVLVFANAPDVWLVLAAIAAVSAYADWRGVQRFIRGEHHILWLKGSAAVIALLLAMGGISFSALLPLHVPQETRLSWANTFAIGRGAYVSQKQALIGTGPDTFTHDWTMYKPLSVNATPLWDVDFSAGAGFVPTAFIEVGLLGLCAWLALLCALIWSFARFLRRGSRHRSGATLFLYIAALYLAFFHVIYAPGIALSALTFLIMGALVDDSVTAQFRSFNGVKSRLVPRASAVICIALIVSAGLLVRATISDGLVNRSALQYRSTGAFDAALSSINLALRIEPHSEKAQRAAVELGLLQLQALLQKSDGSAQTRSLQSTLQSTIQHALTAISIDSADYQNWLSLASLYQSLAGAGVQGAYESAKTAYENAASQNPTDPRPLIDLAQLDLMQKKYSEALDYLNKAVALKKDLSAAYVLRSQTQAQLGNVSQALQDATQATNLAPADSFGFYNLGALYYAQGSYQEAVSALEKAVELQSDYANALFVLGLSYDKLGDTANAISALQKVASLNPTDAVAAQALLQAQNGEPITATSTPQTATSSTP